MRPATERRERLREARLLVVDSHRVAHHRAADLPAMLRRGDLLIANDAATLPASLTGIHRPTGETVEVRLAGRSALHRTERVYTAIVFGAGDYRMPTEQRQLPPPLHVGDGLALGPLRARIDAVIRSPRLVRLRFSGSADEMWEGIARFGRPIQYSYVSAPLEVWDTWTRFAARPVAFEAPSAGFLLDWSMLRAIAAMGARFTTITHAAGISSTGSAELDALLPLDEPYDIPASTAALIANTRRRGGRVIAVGTTVVRALEHAAARGPITAGHGMATNRLGASTRLRVVDAIVTGMHEPGSSHYELLRAFATDEVLARATAEAEAHEYLAHEFGDFLFVERETCKRTVPSVGSVN